MKIPVIAKIEKSCTELDMEEEIEVDSVVDVTLNMIIAYLFQQKYDKPYGELTWFLEDGARDFIKDIENKWMNNEIDELALSRDIDFIEFLRDNYSDITEESLEEELDYFYDECVDEIKSRDKEDVEFLAPSVDVWVYSATSSMSKYIDVDDILEDYFYEEEEDD